jgi:rhodanese-related sulfurtransferase
MNWGRYVLEAATLIVAAIVCALVANGVASRERKLVVVSGSTPARVATATTTTTTTTGGLKPAAPPVVTQTTATQPPAPPPTKPQPATVPNTKHPLNPAATPQPQREPAKEFNPHPDKPYIEIGFDDVKALHDKGVLFLDARRTSVYEQGHIPGARPFSVWESDIDDKVNKLFSERSDPKDQNLPIVVYCSGGDCEDSHMLAQKLWGIQFNNVYVYKDGFPDWQKRGEPVHTGANP